MGLFGKSTVKAHGGAHEDAAREEAAREEAAREEAARKAKFQADEDELKELPFADYTNVFHRASARSQANSVHYGMTINQLKGKDTIEQIKTKIKSVKDELHARCKENDVYAYETHFIRNYLLEQNPVYVVEALICLTEITDKKLITINAIKGNAKKIIELEHILRVHCEHGIEAIAAETKANEEQEEWALEYDKAYADEDEATSRDNTKMENELNRSIRELQSKYEEHTVAEQTYLKTVANSKRFHQSSDDIRNQQYYLNANSTKTKTLAKELDQLKHKLDLQKARRAQPNQ